MCRPSKHGNVAFKYVREWERRSRSPLENESVVYWCLQNSKSNFSTLASWRKIEDIIIEYRMNSYIIVTTCRKPSLHRDHTAIDPNKTYFSSDASMTTPKSATSGSDLTASCALCASSLAASTLACSASSGSNVSPSAKTASFA